MDLEAALRENREAVASLVGRAQRLAAAQWDTPRAPGKWSAGQVVEHVAVAYEAGTKALRGEQSLPPIPRLFRPLVRTLYLRRVLKRGRFPKGKVKGLFTPALNPPRDATLARLRAAAAAFEAEVPRAPGPLDHPVFGNVPVADYVRFNALHTRHHERQLKAP
jgi:hypothetical protein